MKIFFPRNGVRYIAMNDGIDTMRDNNDIAPFKNILNEMYSKDISKKVHSSYLLKAQKGQFTAALPLRVSERPEDKNHLLIDEETAPHCPASVCVGAGRTRPQLHPAQAGRRKNPMPDLLEPGTGLSERVNKWEKKDPVNGRICGTSP